MNAIEKKSAAPAANPTGWKRFLYSPGGLLLLLLGTTFLIYLPALRVPPYLDDNSAILENLRITNPAYLSQIFNGFFFNRGLVQLSLALEWRLSKDAIPLMHLSNIGMHLLAVVLAYYAARAVWKFLYPKLAQKDDWKYYGLISAAVFALHPLNTQPVTYIIARADVMATIFFLLGILIPLQMVFVYSSKPRGLIGRVAWFGATLAVLGICFAFGFSCKEIIATLPPVLLILFVCSWRKEKWPTLLIRFGAFCLPIVGLIGAYLIYRKITFGNYLYIPDIEARSPLVNLYTQICIIVLYYIPRIFIPVNLLFRPPFPLAQSLADPRLIACLFVILSLFVAAAVLWRKKPEFLFGALWFFLTLAPTSSLIPLWDLIAERRIYLASFGFALAAESIFFILRKTPQKNLRSLTLAFSIGVFAIFSILSLQRNFEYQNPARFWLKEHAYSPYNLENLHNYLYTLSQNGEEEQAKKVLTELDWVQLKEKNEFIDTGSLDFLIRMMLHHKIELDYAVFLAEKNAERFPNPYSMNTYQLALMVQRRFKDAMDVIEKTLAINPNHVDTLFNKAFIYRIFNYYNEAQECLTKAMQLQPENIALLEEQVELLKVQQKDAREIEKRVAELKTKNKYSSEMDLRSSL